MITIFKATDRREMAVGVMQRLEDLNTVLGQTNDHRHRVLAAAAKNIKVSIYQAFHENVLILLFFME